MENVSLASQLTGFGIDRIPGHLLHPYRIGVFG
jgi:hypothetical protein